MRHFTSDDEISRDDGISTTVISDITNQILPQLLKIAVKEVFRHDLFKSRSLNNFINDNAYTPKQNSMNSYRHFVIIRAIHLFHVSKNKITSWIFELKRKKQPIEEKLTCTAIMYLLIQIMDLTMWEQKFAID